MRHLMILVVLLAASACMSTRTQPAATTVEAAAVIEVAAAAETDAVNIPGDAADDPALWLYPDPEQSEKSLIIATQKRGGLFVYDLDGNTLQWLPDGQFNNVDLRYNFRLANGKHVDVVVASNRDDNTIALYAVDAAALRLSAIGGGNLKTGLQMAYGLCMGRNDATGEMYVYVDSTDGQVEHYRLVARNDNRIGIRRVRSFRLNGQVEGCVVDDRSATLYVAEEDFGIWKYRAWGGGSDRGRLIARIGQHELVPDIEGLAIMHLPQGAGYLLASSQGNDSFALFDLTEPNAWLARIRIIGNGSGVDGVSGTDGIEVLASAVGRYANGLLVVQDDQNTQPAQNQDFKLVDWGQVAVAGGLKVFPQWDPRYP